MMVHLREITEKLKSRIRTCTFGAIKSEYDDPQSSVCFVYIVNREPLTDIAAQIHRFDGNCAAHVRDQLEAMLTSGRIVQVMYNAGNAPADKQQFLVDMDDINISQPCIVLRMDMTYLVKFQDEPGF